MGRERCETRVRATSSWSSVEEPRGVFSSSGVKYHLQKELMCIGMDHASSCVFDRSKSVTNLDGRGGSAHHAKCREGKNIVSGSRK